MDIENTGKPMKMTANQIAIACLREQGLNGAETARQLGLSKGYVTYVDQKLNRKYDLTDTKMLKSAHRAVKSLLAGEPFGTIEKVKDSTALAAAQMVYDKAQPVIKSSDVPVNISFTQINLS